MAGAIVANTGPHPCIWAKEADYGSVCPGNGVAFIGKHLPQQKK